jgi:hypothetical protein
MGNHPPKPRLALAVGVIGHRPNRLHEQKRSEVMTHIRQVLAQISEAADAVMDRHRASFSEGRAAITLISGLAEGADRMAAEAAIEEDLELSVILPFAIETYEQEFEGKPSKVEYRTLAAKARKNLILCGEGIAEVMRGNTSFPTKSTILNWCRTAPTPMTANARLEKVTTGLNTQKNRSPIRSNPRKRSPNCPNPKGCVAKLATLAARTVAGSLTLWQN